MKKVESVCQVINTYFNLKAKPWQVDAFMDITKCKRDVCAIVSINASKSFIYQSIPIVIGRFVLVILPIIALMEDRVCITPKMLYNHHLYLTI